MKFLYLFCFKLTVFLFIITFLLISNIANENKKLKGKLKKALNKNGIKPLSKLTKLLEMKINEINKDILEYQMSMTQKENMILDINPLKIETYSNKLIIKLRTVTRMLQHSRKFIQLFQFRKVTGFPVIDKKMFSKKGQLALCVIGKQENVYAKEFINYYINLGASKIYLYDNNDLLGEKFEDVLKEEIKKEYVEIIDVRGLYGMQAIIYQDCYQEHKYEYDWFLNIDFDEFIYLPNNNKFNNILDTNLIKNCNLIKFHWRIYDDNNKVHYENESLIKRFTHFINQTNRFVKTLIRGGLNNIIMGAHYPDYMENSSFQCFPSGETNETDVYKYGYIKHFLFKTAEELCSKIIKGDVLNTDYFKNIKRTGLIDRFFEINKISIEKIKIIEKCLNITLPNWRNKLKNFKYI